MNTDYSYIRNLLRLCFSSDYQLCVVVFVDHVFHQVEECGDIQVHVLGVADIIFEVVKHPFVVFGYHNDCP